MKRRTVLGGVGGVATVGLAGCIDSFQEHFTGELSTPIPVEIYNEGGRAYSVQLEAYERDTDRQTYDEGYTVRPEERVGPPHLEGVEQRFRVIRFEGDGEENLVETGPITTETQLVRIVIYDDDLLLEITEDEDAEPGEGPTNETETNGNGTGNETETDENETDTDENETGSTDSDDADDENE